MADNELINEIYQEYKIARDSLQLLHASVVRCDAQKGASKKIYNTDVNVGLEVKQKHQWKDETTAVGYLLTDIVFGPLQDRETFILKVRLEIEGIFKVEEKQEDRKVLDKRLALQLVPQLIPYARGAAMTIAALMGVAVPYELIPTMDILKSIRENRNHD